MPTRKTVLIAGIGGVGYETLRHLTKSSVPDHLVVGDIDHTTATRRAGTARMEADMLGHSARVTTTEIDLLDVNRTREALEQFEPDVVFVAATLLEWWVDKLRDDVSPRAVEYTPEGPGAGLLAPGQIPLVHNLVTAIQRADIDTPHVVDAPFPDLVVPVMHATGFDSIVGIGNVGMLVSPLRDVASRELGVPPDAVTVYFATTHAGVHLAFETGSTQGVPYYLKVLVDGDDVTDRVDPDGALGDSGLDFPSVLDGRGRDPMVAAHAARVITALLTDSGETIHVPGAAGRLGGYPARIDRNGARVVLPSDTTTNHVEGINREALRYDGIADLRDDGTVVFTDRAAAVLEEEFGIEAPEFSPAEARDLTAKLDEFVTRS